MTSLDDAQALIGTTVSVDVSTGDHDHDWRIFATVIEIQQQGDGVVLLAEEDSRNFGAGATPPPGDVLEELRALADRYPKTSMDHVRMLRIVSAYEAQEKRIAERVDEMRAEIVVQPR